VQRRHQKVVEIAPAKDLPTEVRNGMLNDAVRLAKSVGYRKSTSGLLLINPNPHSHPPNLPPFHHPSATHPPRT
jgi:pyruvate carboxylase